MQSSSDPNHAPLPERIGPFAVTARITRGQLADVFLAERAANARERVAIKQVRSELATVSGWCDLLVDEAALLATVEHPNLVSLSMRGEEGAPYLALEYIEGSNLEVLLERAGSARTGGLIAAVVADALRGLGALHTARALDDSPLEIVHQAPRPRHIVVGTDGRARLVDLSQAFARTIGASPLRRQRLRAGSMAPEHTLAPDRIDARADLFILGITLWEALTGRALFGLPNAPRGKSGESLYPRPSTLSASVPDAFDSVCLRALARDPDRRFGSAEEMLAELLAAARRCGGIASPSEVAAWALAAGGRLVSARPLSDDAVSSYRPPAASPHAVERVGSLGREIESALKQAPAAVTQELYRSAGSAGKPATKPPAAPARFDKTINGVVPRDLGLDSKASEPKLDAEPKSAKAKAVDESQGAREPATPPKEPAEAATSAASSAREEPRAADEGAAVASRAARPEEPRPKQRSREHAQPAPRNQAGASAAPTPAPTPSTRARERHDRLAASLLTASLVFAMLVIGDVAIRKLLPPPEPPRLPPSSAGAQAVEVQPPADTALTHAEPAAPLPAENALARPSPAAERAPVAREQKPSAPTPPPLPSVPSPGIKTIGSTAAASKSKAPATLTNAKRSNADDPAAAPRRSPANAASPSASEQVPDNPYE